jgi:3-hydroxyisobutyrate dehydrogenase-like beta-hydroxyacid dehydrogenase
MEVGFIGLGAMGRAMAATLLKAGHRVRIWNRSSAPVEELARQGAEPVKEAGLAFGGVVISMLADDESMREIILGRRLVEAAPPGTVHVNMATISVRFAELLTTEHRRHGVQYVSAPVFGRPDMAAAGQLNIVAAGDDAAIDRAQPVLDAIGQRTWRVGAEPRQANAVKLAGNFMIAAAIETMGEAAAMVERYGVPAAEPADQYALRRAGLQELRRPDRGPEIRTGGVPTRPRAQGSAPRVGGCGGGASADAFRERAARSPARGGRSRRWGAGLGRAGGGGAAARGADRPGPRLTPWRLSPTEPRWRRWLDGGRGFRAFGRSR